MSDNGAARAKFLRFAYAQALRRLRNNHPEEFHEILESIYTENNVSVKKRLTGSRKIKADMQRLMEKAAETAQA